MKLADLLKPIATVFLATAALFLAIFAALSVPASSTRPDETLVIDLHDTALPVVVRDGPSGFGFVFTFDGEATKHSLTHPDDPAVALRPHDKELAGDIINDLAECSPGPAKPVEIAVVGFASSSDWSNEEISVSRDDNLDLARVRAIGLKNALETIAREKGVGTKFKIDAPTWPSFEAMESQRLFNDRVHDGIGGRYSIRAGRLTRRAELRIVNASACAEHQTNVHVTSLGSK